MTPMTTKTSKIDRGEVHQDSADGIIDKKASRIDIGLLTSILRKFITPGDDYKRHSWKRHFHFIMEPLFLNAA